MKRIEEEHEQARRRAKSKRIHNALVDEEFLPEDVDEMYGEDEGGGACLFCYK